VLMEKRHLQVLTENQLAIAGADAQSEDGHALLGQQRSTLCVSSQVGCQMGCTFCATGRNHARDG
jgi:adenine C2-methylase RlmN of 23S rRNA A2503 and tRNA A37